MQLSKHLTLQIASASATATARKIPNVPTGSAIDSLKLLGKNIYDPIIDKFGPVQVTSGFRTLALNNAIGGAKDSQHMRGEALDLVSIKPGTNNADLFNFVRQNLPFDQLIWEFGTDKNPAWIHVSYNTRGSRQRQEIILARKVNGATKYTPFGTGNFFFQANKPESKLASGTILSLLVIGYFLHKK
jgi:hypothetical protein